MMIKLKIYSTLFICVFTLSLQAQDLNFRTLIQPVPAVSKFTDPGYQVWCGSMIQGDDARYYLFYSRWSDTLKHDNWAISSEVALAVSDHALGPYKFLKVVLPKRDKKYWDADVTHNPTIHKFDGKYYLYYMGNYGNGEYWDHRNHQRIGVAVAKSPLGPWKRSSKPIIDVSPGYDSLLVSNPAICRGADGRFVMVYKSVGPGKKPFGGKVSHRVAFSKSPTGKFTKMPDPIFMQDSVKFPAEDPYIWFQNGKYWALVKDFAGTFTKQGLSLALFESTDAVNWSVSKHALASPIEIPWTSGTEKVKRLERPQLYLENGVPTILFVAVMDTHDMPYNVAIPLKAAK
jgi:predicted GH43/DUF377 family glycosyl hydrolase